MKTILITVITMFLSNAIFATELSWVDEQIEAIKPPRKSVKIVNINNPFIFLEKNKTKKKDSKAGIKVASFSGVKAVSSKSSNITDDSKSNQDLVLSTIINSTAMIDGSWYKKDEIVRGYTVMEVTKTSVTLKKDNKELILSTNLQNQNLKFKNK